MILKYEVIDRSSGECKIILTAGFERHLQNPCIGRVPIGRGVVGGTAETRCYIQDEWYFVIEHMDVRHEASLGTLPSRTPGWLLDRFPVSPSPVR